MYLAIKLLTRTKRKCILFLVNSNSISWMLTVVLADINDNAPIFPKVSGFLFSVKETECKNVSLTQFVKFETECLLRT